MQGLVRPRRALGPFEGAIHRDAVAMSQHPMGKFPMTQQSASRVEQDLFEIGCWQSFQQAGHSIRVRNRLQFGKRRAQQGPRPGALPLLRRLATRGQLK